MVPGLWARRAPPPYERLVLCSPHMSRRLWPQLHGQQTPLHLALDNSLLSFLSSQRIFIFTWCTNFVFYYYIFGQSFFCRVMFTLIIPIIFGKQLINGAFVTHHVTVYALFLHSYMPFDCALLVLHLWFACVASLRSLLIVRGDAACHASAHFIIYSNSSYFLTLSLST